MDPSTLAVPSTIISNASAIGVQVVHARHLPSLAIQQKRKPLMVSSPRCTQCGLVIPDIFKLIVIDPFDSYCKTSSEEQIEACKPLAVFGITSDKSITISNKSRPVLKDYVRLLYSFERDRFPHKLELSREVFCTPYCLRTYAKTFLLAICRSQIDDLIAEMLLYRHGITESTVCAPPVESLDWIWKWQKVEGDQKIATPSGYGLSTDQFYQFLSQRDLGVRIAGRCEFVAPDWDEGQAIVNQDGRILPTCYIKGMDPVVAKRFQVPGRPPLSTEAYPDSDEETNYATGEIYSQTSKK